MCFYLFSAPSDQGEFLVMLKLLGNKSEAPFTRQCFTLERKKTQWKKICINAEGLLPGGLIIWRKYRMRLI